MMYETGSVSDVMCVTMWAVLNSIHSVNCSHFKYLRRLDFEVVNMQYSPSQHTHMHTQTDIAS